MTFTAGQLWTYKTPVNCEDSRIVIGAIATCGDGRHIICFSVTNAPRIGPQGEIEKITIPFIPMSESAFQATVRELAGEADPPESFSDGLQAWSEDARGLSIFTVPFEGFLDRMIALQMAAIVGKPAA
ncbi:MAG: hypothetical protein KJ622_09390 [Alphaproteobacteria bacterium]|nr:hypothetical protein [Alphaproteobacteria bacterium]